MQVESACKSPYPPRHSPAVLTSLPTYVDAQVLVFLGSLFSIGWINLFLYFTTLANSRHGDETVAGRAASAIGLVLLACICESQGIREAIRSWNSADAKDLCHAQLATSGLARRD